MERSGWREKGLGQIDDLAGPALSMSDLVVLMGLNGSVMEDNVSQPIRIVVLTHSV